MADENKNLPSTQVEEGRAAVRTGARPEALVPTTLKGVWQVAEIIHASGMAPKDMNNADKLSVAIMHGMEVGLTPMAAIQSIAVVNGRPTIWGDGALGLIRGSGLLASFKEYLTGEGDQLTAFCEVRRKNEDGTITGQFSMADARLAGLAGKDIWSKYPKRMLQMRARAFALRDAFADVLRGLAIREEMEDVERVTHEPPAAPLAPPAAPPPPPAPPASQARPQEQVEDADAVEIDEEAEKALAVERAKALIEEIRDQLATVQTEVEVDELREGYDVLMTERLSRHQRETADSLFQQRAEALRPKPKTEQKPAPQEDDAGSPPPAPKGRGKKEEPKPDPTPEWSAPGDNPFAIPPLDAFKTKDGYRHWLRETMLAVETIEHDTPMRQCWIETKPHRAALGYEPTERNDLQAEVQKTLEALQKSMED